MSVQQFVIVSSLLVFLSSVSPVKQCFNPQHLSYHLLTDRNFVNR
jgi:hypothetical protein